MEGGKRGNYIYKNNLYMCYVYLYEGFIYGIYGIISCLLL